MNLIKHATDSSFEEDVLKCKKAVLVDFWAGWCSPCKALSVVLEEIAQEYNEKVQFVKINVDENEIIPTQFSVRGIPTLILFKNGIIKDRKVGALTKLQLSDFLDNNI